MFAIVDLGFVARAAVDSIGMDSKWIVAADKGLTSASMDFASAMVDFAGDMG